MLFTFVYTVPQCCMSLSLQRRAPLFCTRPNLDLLFEYYRQLVEGKLMVVLAHNSQLELCITQALLRPGRFDRQISIDRPDITGREQIFRVYLEKIKLDKPIKHYSERMAALTPGACFPQH